MWRICNALFERLRSSDATESPHLVKSSSPNATVRPLVWLPSLEDGSMSKKRPKPEEIVAKLLQADGLVDRGHSVAVAIRAIGMSEVTYWRWRRG
jgi:hypothetical protein